MPGPKNITAGILLTAGPVSTHTAFKSQSRVFNMSINKAKYLGAAQKLQDLGLGTLVVLENISCNTKVFVKKMPSEVRPIMEANPSMFLFSPMDYEKRFYMPPSKTLSNKIQKHLVESGLVPQQLFCSPDSPDVKPAI